MSKGDSDRTVNHQNTRDTWDRVFGSSVPDGHRVVCINYLCKYHDELEHNFCGLNDDLDDSGRCDKSLGITEDE